MMRRHTKMIVIGVIALLALAVGGGAIAATALDPKEESEAVVNDAAQQLGVEPDELTAALKEALSNRVEAAVEAGRLTEAQGEAIKERIQSGEVPLLGLGPAFGPHRVHHHPDLEAAAAYLGMTEANLRTALGNGRTLAQLARARGKSVNGLVTAMTKAATAELAEAVESGRLTDAQRDRIVSGLKERITRLVNDGPRFGHRGEPPVLGSAA
jgi:hypothetical protein